MDNLTPRRVLAPAVLFGGYPRDDRAVSQLLAAVAVRSKGAAPHVGHANDRVLKKAIATVLATLGYRVEGIRYTPHHWFEPSRLWHLEFDDVICRHLFE